MPKFFAEILTTQAVPKELEDIFLTEWREGRDRYGAHAHDGKRAYGMVVRAENEEEAESLYRKLGKRLFRAIEAYIGRPNLRPSDHFEARDYATCMHSMIFYAWKHIKLGKVTVDECFSDEGYVHVFAHFCVNKFSPQPGSELGVLSEENMLKYIQQFEAKCDNLV